MEVRDCSIWRPKELGSKTELVLSGLEGLVQGHRLKALHREEGYGGSSVGDMFSMR